MPQSNLAKLNIPKPGTELEYDSANDPPAGVDPATVWCRSNAARPQTVDRDLNPRYWQLLDRFESMTGVPVLLNTSFNIQEPIVCRPEEALATFARSGMDGLAIGDYWVTHVV